MFISSFIIFIIMLFFTLFAIKRKWYGILLFIAIIAFLAPLYSLYQTGVSTDWRFLGDGYWVRVIFFIILDIPSLIILGVIAFNFNPSLTDKYQEGKTWFNKSIKTMFIMRLLFHAGELVLGG